MKLVLILALTLFASACGNNLTTPKLSEDNSATKKLYFQDSQQTLFKIIRTNYKEDHILHYDVRFGNNCEIMSGAPIDGYYMRNRSRIEFNDKNKEYYEPRALAENRSESHVEFDFPILRQLDTLEPELRRIFVDVKREGSACTATGSLIYQGESYRMKNITMKLKMIFGFPTGTEWARLEAVNKSGKPGFICLLGDCE